MSIKILRNWTFFYPTWIQDQKEVLYYYYVFLCVIYSSKSLDIQNDRGSMVEDSIGNPNYQVQFSPSIVLAWRLIEIRNTAMLFLLSFLHVPMKRRR